MEGWGKWFADGLRALAATPVSLFLAVLVFGLIVLYAPPIAGFDLTAARVHYGLGFRLITLAAGLLFIVRTLAFIAYNSVKFGLIWFLPRPTKPTPSLVITLNPQVNTAWWATTRQADGSVTTQICVDFFAHNPTHSMVYLRACRLISPRVRAEEGTPPVLVVSDPMGNRAGSSSQAVWPGGNSSIRAVFILRRRLGRPGGFLSVVFGVTDQHGFEYRVHVKLWPKPTSG